VKNPKRTVKCYVLDTSAFMTLIEDEAGADAVQELLQQAELNDAKIFASFVSFTEVFYITLQEHNAEEARMRIDLMKKLPIERIESTADMGILAGELKARNKISFADAWIAATAKFYQAILVHKDPEFEQLKSEISSLSLPYK
jgi:uncharacterized protein